MNVFLAISEYVSCIIHSFELVFTEKQTKKKTKKKKKKRPNRQRYFLFYKVYLDELDDCTPCVGLPKPQLLARQANPLRQKLRPQAKWLFTVTLKIGDTASLRFLEIRCMKHSFCKCLILASQTINYSWRNSKQKFTKFSSNN